MFSVWEISTDSIVTALIVVCISALAIAWLFAGRRRPSKGGSLEQRRLAGREAEVDAAPPVDAPSPEPVSADMVDDAGVEAPLIEAPMPAPATAIDHLRNAEAEILLPAEPAQKAHTQSPPPASAPEPACSPEKASAISIAAALVRHDKRETAPPKSLSKELPPKDCGPDGDDLTAIGGIDPDLAKELNDLGIRYFDQIITMSPDHAVWIASRLGSTVSSAQRSAWIAEAKALVEHETQAIRKQTERAG